MAACTCSTFMSAIVLISAIIDNVLCISFSPIDIIVSNSSKDRIRDKTLFWSNTSLEGYLLFAADELKKSSLIVPPILYDIYPAPLTAILRDEDSGNTVAVRVPNDSFIGEIIKKVGPIWSTSVNISGQPSLTTFDEILAVFDSKVDFIVKKNIGSKGLPSTLVDFSSSEIKILRQGAFDIKPYLI